MIPFSFLFAGKVQPATVCVLSELPSSRQTLPNLTFLNGTTLYFFLLRDFSFRAASPLIRSPFSLHAASVLIQRSFASSFS